MLRTCKICGKEFDAKSSRRSICYDRHVKHCVICGAEFELKNPPYTQVTCASNKCRAAYMRQVSQHVKTCEWCGRKFTPSSPRQKYCSGPHYGKCPVCGAQVAVTNLNQPIPCCSEECRQKLRERTTQQRFGVGNAMQSDSIKQKMQDRNLAKYGVRHVFQTDAFKSKAKQTMEMRYGVEYSSQCEESRKKFNSTCLSRYGVPEPLQNIQIRAKVSQSIQEKYGVPWYCMTEDYHKFQTVVSKINRDFGGLLKHNGIEYKFEHRIENRSYDIELINRKILIEINPTITHNSYFSIFDTSKSGLDKNYHKDKTILAEESGFRCINVWDWDNWENIIDLVKPIDKLYARDGHVATVSKAESDKFLRAHHLQGSCRNQLCRYGLYFDNTLVELMVFGKPRYNKNYEWELLRLCTDSKYRVVGGAERLFSHFVADYDPKSIISYCDRSKFSGEVYTRIGFNLQSRLQPSKIWSKKHEMIRDSLLLARGYDQLFKTNYGKGASNEQLMLDSGWLPVYDCGQAVYTYHNM